MNKLPDGYKWYKCTISNNKQGSYYHIYWQHCAIAKSMEEFQNETMSYEEEDSDVFNLCSKLIETREIDWYNLELPLLYYREIRICDNSFLSI